MPSEAAERAAREFTESKPWRDWVIGSLGTGTLRSALAALLESFAAERVAEEREALWVDALTIGDAVLPVVREKMGDHPMFSDAGYVTWISELARTIAACIADAAIRARKGA